MSIRKECGRSRAFTLVELIVVITILAILATVGFLSLSGYSDDARSATVAANVRTVYSAILTESTTSGNSPRWYVEHDNAAALTGGAVAFVDGNPVILTGGNFGDAGTNYSAGNPRWDRLRMNGEKFRLSGAFPDPAGFLTDPAFAAYSSGAVSVGAFDATGKGALNGRPRTVSYFQVAGVSPSTKKASVTGNYMAAGTGAALGLVYDPSSTSSTGALVDGTSSTWSPVSIQSNPSALTLSHSSRSKTFSVSWTGGYGNGSNCKLQYLKNGTTWTDISATTYNCDSTISNQSVTLPGDGWYSGNWNATQIRLIRSPDSASMGTFPQTLSCSATAASASPTPSVDEDCNGTWDNSATTYCTNAGCASWYLCVAHRNCYMPDGMGCPTPTTSMCAQYNWSQVYVYSWYHSYTYTWLSVGYQSPEGCGTSRCITTVQTWSGCSYSAACGTEYR